MSFQTPKSVEGMLTSIHRRAYLMPAIQREFVWGPPQIVRLVDSLMRGYPVGSFLLWEVTPETAASYTFYEFLTDFHERDRPYANKATVPSGMGTTAILDGQQRLTALNIALYGSYAEKKKYAWRTSADAYPVKHLYLNLLDPPKDEELGLRYDLRFLTLSEAAPAKGEPDKWFRLGDVLRLPDAGPSMNDELLRRGLTGQSEPYHRLYDLHNAMRQLKPMNYFLVSDQDADKVLEIFVRVNSGGTQLSYSDLLLSMATNQWRDLDAREEVRSLVSDLNSNAQRQFAFTKDNVLKAALCIAGIDLRFHVANFTAANMHKVESQWPDIRAALLRAATLLKQFGYNERNLTANSVIVPLAHYLHARGATDAYLTSAADAKDRNTVQLWVTRSLVKRGIWGSGLDTLLGRLRDEINNDPGNGFPVEAIERAMATVGKSLTFTDAEVDELLDLTYGGQRTFPVLSLLYPGLDFSKQFHEDHVFPKSRFTRKRLAAARVAEDDLDAYLDAFNRLPNLQLLAGQANVEKQSAMPQDWMASDYFTRDDQRDAYVRENDLAGLPADMTGFLDFYQGRKASMRDRLIRTLGATALPPGSD